MAATALAMGDPDDDSRASRPTAADIANATTPVDETLWERRWQACSLRNAGMTFEQIARIQHISPAQVRKDVALAKREIMAEPVEDMVARQRSVLLDMQRAMYAQALSGDTKAVAAIIKGLEQEAKLLGLYRPAQVHIGVSDHQFRDRATELILALRPDTLKELTRGHATTDQPGGPPAEPVPTEGDDGTVDAEVVPIPAAGDGDDAGLRGVPVIGTTTTDQGDAPVDGADAADDGWANL